MILINLCQIEDYCINECYVNEFTGIEGQHFKLLNLKYLYLLHLSDLIPNTLEVLKGNRFTSSENKLLSIKTDVGSGGKAIILSCKKGN